MTCCERYTATSGKWQLLGYDTFEERHYPLPGEFETEELALEAAAARLRDLEATQPTERSGGQDFFGIQDRVFIVRPDGTRYRFFAGLTPQR